MLLGRDLPMLAVALAIAWPPAAVANAEPDGCSSTQEPLELCSVTRVSSDDAGVVLVEVPNKSTIRGGTGPTGGVSFDGGDRLVGFFLIPDEEPRGYSGIVGFRMQDEGFPPPPEFFGGYGEGFPLECPCALPAGRYRLYIFTDSAATVTLRFSGLSGSADYTPSRATNFEVSTLTERFHLEPTGNLYSAGDSGELRGPGIVLQSIWSAGPIATHYRYGNCLYFEPPDSPIAYAPGCPDASAVATKARTSLGDDGIPQPYADELTSFWILEDPGEYGSGVWAMSAGPAHSFGTLGAWLSFGD